MDLHHRWLPLRPRSRLRFSESRPTQRVQWRKGHIPRQQAQAISFTTIFLKPSARPPRNSMMLRRPPGREACPGDVFYLHTRACWNARKIDEKWRRLATSLPVNRKKAGGRHTVSPTFRQTSSRYRRSDLSESDLFNAAFVRDQCRYFSNAGGRENAFFFYVKSSEEAGATIFLSTGPLVPLVEKENSSKFHPAADAIQWAPLRSPLGLLICHQYSELAALSRSLVLITDKVEAGARSRAGAAHGHPKQDQICR